jgi:PAS domain S-box-containing protein
MLGYTQDDMIGSHVNKFFDQENFNIVAANFKKRKTGEEQSYTVTFRRKDGTELSALVAPAVVYDDKGAFQQSIAVISDISEQVETQQLLDLQMQERIQEISSLMEVSEIVVSSLTFEEQIKIILQKLKELIKYDGASVILDDDNFMITDSFQLKIPENISKQLLQPFIQRDFFDSKFYCGEALILPNIRSQSHQQNDFYHLTESFLGSVPEEMVCWIGVPIKSRNNLIGVLSAHAAQEAHFTPDNSFLMQAFANQIAIIFENNRLYEQAELAGAATERERLARELHDSVTQSLYSVRLYAEAVRSALKIGKLSAAEKHLDRLTAIARDGMSSLRLLIFELRPPVLEELGLIGALQKRLEMVESRAGIKTNCVVVGEPEVSEEVETQLYWVVYEALSNVLKHANAVHVSLNFEFSDEGLSVIIQDDGMGFDPTTLPQSHEGGLKNVIERVESIGGKISIESKLGEGTKIKINYHH